MQYKKVIAKNVNAKCEAEIVAFEKAKDAKNRVTLKFWQKVVLSHSAN